MTIKQQIQQLNQSEDARALRQLAEKMRGGINWKGRRVYFDYRDMQEFFQRCDPTIDRSRFEELMQIADYAA